MQTGSRLWPRSPRRCTEHARHRQPAAEQALSVSPSPTRLYNPAPRVPSKSDSWSSASLASGQEGRMPSLRTAASSSSFRTELGGSWQDLCLQRLEIAETKLSQQYSHRTLSPRSPGRSPRSGDYGATSPRNSTCASSPRLFFSGHDAVSQAQTNCKMLERELAVLQGLMAEVSVRISSLDARTAMTASKPTRNEMPLILSSSSASCSSARPTRLSQVPPPAAVAAESRLAQPCSELDAMQHLSEALQQMVNRITIANMRSLDFIAGIQDHIASEQVHLQRPQRKRSTSSVAAVYCSRRSNQAMEQRGAALHRSLRSHIVGCKPLCREAEALSSRVMHELTSTCELFEVSDVLCVDSLQEESSLALAEQMRSTLQPASDILDADV